ncbi:N-6 DNA methylase [Sphingobacterium sp. WM]|uniref:type ISP restriction/modification enzyme n=1 Tax=Sphingobacterium sp. WM TaxID=3031802 RepID=UPI00240D167E|nr:type ISP restriction/modification enzyme [Sphingobacterium sp. WM]WFB61984.1 N-6 DNA methylase [Sphingobacterium sp. WM]
MDFSVKQYINNINRLYITGNAREHSYRGDLQRLLSSILPKDILVTNEPARVECGAPDYVLTKGVVNIPVGYIEAKDVNVDLKSKTLKEQFDRYRLGLSNLIITDYLHFVFYKDGEYVVEIRIAQIKNGNIIGINANFDQFETLIKNFAETITQTIKSPTKLAKLMAGKARLMANVIEQSLDSDDAQEKNSSLKGQMLSFKQMLIHDITNRSFSDIYAQTIAYGMFAARYHDPSLPTFSRIEAAELIPKSNPFLRKLFQDIAGFDVDSRIVWIVDELVTIFLATDVAKIMKTFGRSTKMEDPIIHFYETFLAEYDKSLRKALGVWYTPQPVVNFIVRAVDDILKDEFGLAKGLADNSKSKITVKVPTHDKRYKAGVVDYEKEVHRVQVLDPATGTGTFLAEMIKHIHSKFKGMEGMWQKYVKEDLIPRMNGFELLMASYAMAHLKMDMLLTETGYVADNNQRFRIFLTNSLEEAHPDSNTLFSSWLSDESNQANEVKKDTPVMVVMGNPPYSVSSTNKSPWIENLVADYKRDLNERNINPLSDDYIKFIRYGQHFIDKNGTGILAYISNNSFIDGIIHRQMRKSLLESFDKIFLVDLHGNAKKKEVSLDGGIDQNVFDIMQGVSINIFIKTGKKNRDKFAKVYHYDLFGKREEKYKVLGSSHIKSFQWSEVNLNKKTYLFKNQDLKLLTFYNSQLNVEKLFTLNATGIKTERDDFVIKYTKIDVNQTIEDLKNLDLETLRYKYQLKPDGRDWKLINAKNDVINSNFEKIKLQYRPFDIRYSIYTGNSKGFMAYPRHKIMKHLAFDNIAFITTRLNRGLSTGYVFLSSVVLDLHLLDSAADSLQTFPLYLYPDTNGQLSTDEHHGRVPNLNKEIVAEIAKRLGLMFTNEKEVTEGTFGPIDILDYIYAVLHSPAYREKYKEFLKVDFPRVPYPTDPTAFWQLVELGGQIRVLHLLESKKLEDLITSYPVGGNNIVGKSIFKDGKVYINETQYFDNVPQLAWNFYIGGYQPAQKWLKERKDRELDFDDVLHYQKMIVSLTETDRLMKEIDKVLEV